VYLKENKYIAVNKEGEPQIKKRILDTNPRCIVFNETFFDRFAEGETEETVKFVYYKEIGFAGETDIYKQVLIDINKPSTYKDLTPNIDYFELIEGFPKIYILPTKDNF
jgi:hypothetical protein